MTEPDRLILQALARYEAGVCECGHHRSESMASEHDPSDPDHVARYVAGDPFRCLSCTELARAQKAYMKALGDDNADVIDGTKWATELVPRKRATAAAGA
jgi:hypothetical protein